MFHHSISYRFAPPALRLRGRGQDTLFVMLAS